MIVDADLLVQQMTIEQKAGAMMMVGFPGRELTAELENHLRKLAPSGVILTCGNLKNAPQTRKLISDLQALAGDVGAKSPLLIGVNQEGGVVNDLGFGRAISPGNMAIGATRNTEYAYEAARLSAQELRSLGINLNFAPVMDISDNPQSPVVSVRAFSDKEDVVSQLGAKALRGYQENGVAACVKHFPGLGGALADPEQELPTVLFDDDRMQAVEFKPFASAISSNVEFLMVANVRYPNISWEGLPASMSSKIVGSFLRNVLNFKGIVTCDSLTKKAIIDNYSLEEAVAKCIRAGVDMVTIHGNFEDQERVLRGILKGLNDREYTETRIDESLRKILRARHRRPVPVSSSEDPTATMMKIARDSITLLRNDNEILPIRPGQEEYIGIFNPVSPEEDIPTLAEFFTAKHPWIEEVQYNPSDEDLNWEDITARMEPCKWIIFATCSRGPLSAKEVWWVRKTIALEKPTLVVALCSPYNIMQLGDVPACLLTYGYRAYSLEAAVEVILGENPPKGRLPVGIPDLFKSGDGLAF